MSKKCLSFQKAIDALHVKNSRIILMHTKDGDEYFVVPGGMVDKDDAKKIINRPDVVPFEDGLFPGNSQTWKMVRE